MKKIVQIYGKPMDIDSEKMFAEYDRGDVLSSNCPSREIMKHITSRWGIMVFVVLRDREKHRFSHLRRRIEGVSEKMLAQTLKQLEGDGLVERIVYPVVPPHVEYQLTELGHEACKKVLELVCWIEGNTIDIMEQKLGAG
ncbi:winged helix-turn-helix transcriptional regulator [Marinomonas mediterranea]|uniref:Transcriptional regulator, HxlR family n=1 Tax=Marinomonas mediterranea (strain ATCC 700492 / JCM 21426 / NBRC 103028 / MMB-1) TaxID=717774 RepID=F2JUH9_MARM1|nr:helix-turn-helix domain-containing protein [Marinomonas mediterranea]ADZ89312.1 transcriptional regulator, HxlR family [Marinomonas mediterranea MMB-1]